jgi:S-adenosylmethionine/arginine decarboxylase-like enzyme
MEVFERINNKEQITEMIKLLDDKAFGSQIKVSVIVARGPSSKDLFSQITREMVTAINMNCDGLFAASWDFPVFGGKGGTGTTFIQPLVESFIAVDSWPELDMVYFFIVSCKEYDENIVIDLLNTTHKVVNKHVFYIGA